MNVRSSGHRFSSRLFWSWVALLAFCLIEQSVRAGTPDTDPPAAHRAVGASVDGEVLVLLSATDPAGLAGG